MEIEIIPLQSGDGDRQIGKDREIILKLENNPTTAYLRWYTWDPPTFSIGYTQRPEQVFDPDKLKRLGVPWVKRSTGGSLVYHKGDLSYSLMLPKINPWRIRSSPDLYRFTGDIWTLGIRSLGIDACRPPTDSIPRRRDRSNPGLDFCLACSSIGDIMLDGKKVGGSSQRRFAGIWYQQGFFLLDTPPIPDCFRDADAIRSIDGNCVSLRSAGFNRDAGCLSDILSRTFREICLEGLQ